MNVVTPARLSRATARVRRQLQATGLWDETLAEVEVALGTVGLAYGWHYESGAIVIPLLSLARLRDGLTGGYTSLADVIRHEYGHAFADTHRCLIRSRQFNRAFGLSYWSANVAASMHCVTEYATTSAAEDFAETFMFYVRHEGAIPLQFQDCPEIGRKWRFIKHLTRAILGRRSGS